MELLELMLLKLLRGGSVYSCKWYIYHEEGTETLKTTGVGRLAILGAMWVFYNNEIQCEIMQGIVMQLRHPSVLHVHP